MKTRFAKKINLSMVLQWITFLPIILPLCIVFGAINGIVDMVEKMAQSMWTDIES